MIGLVTRARLAPLGQMEMQSLSLCSIVKPILGLPGVKDIVNKVGCEPASRSMLSSAIIANYTKETGGSVTSAPWYTQVLAVAGPEVIADCVCQGWKPPPGGGASQGKSALSNPLVIGAIALGAVAIAVVAARSQRPPKPQPADAAAPDAKPSATASAAPAAPAKTSAPDKTQAKASQRRRSRRY